MTVSAFATDARGRRRSNGAIPAFLLLVVALCSLGASVRPADALVELDITRGKIQPLPIAIPNFYAAPADAQLAADIASVISDDLRHSGLFLPVDPSSFPVLPASTGDVPAFAEWRVIGAQALVIGGVARQSDGRLRAEFRLWDIFAGQQMAGQQFFTSPDNWRRVAHIIADAVYERLTGEKGYFDTRIVFVDESGPKDRRIKRLALMDQDGANVRYLTNGQDLVLTPRFSPTTQEVTYMSYAGGGEPSVYLLNVESGQRELVGNFPGMTFAPRFSPDGQQVIMSLQQEGNANIFAMDLRTRRTTRLTDDAAIDTSPSYSPDGRQIVFESDRGGSQQIYVMGSDGSNPHRISFGEGSYSTPVWSPRGDLSAFWAPNGRVLMFFRDTPGANGGPQLWTIDLTGYNEFRVPTPDFGSDPAWSPLIN